MFLLCQATEVHLLAISQIQFHKLKKVELKIQRNLIFSLLNKFTKSFNFSNKLKSPSSNRVLLLKIPLIILKLKKVNKVLALTSTLRVMIRTRFTTKSRLVRLKLQKSYLKELMQSSILFISFLSISS